MQTRNGEKRQELRIKGSKESIIWWRNYNNIKHRRIGLVEGTNNFQLANQQNLILAFSALFLLETVYIDELKKSEMAEFQESSLFKMVEAK